jgi:DNA-binding transcriptional ArsR family regulator
MANVSAARVVEVLGDPTRRSLLERLAAGPRAVGQLAAEVPVTRPAVSQHLAVLEGAGLVTHTREGRRHIYRVDPGGLAALRAWVDHLWDGALGTFAAAVDLREEDST